MKKTVLISCLLAFVITASAIPAKKGAKKYIKLANGTSVLAELKGDEFKSYWQAEDGKCYALDPEIHVFRNVDLQTFTPSSEKGKNEANNARMMRWKKNLITRSTIGEAHTPYIGKKKGLIILAEFKNKKFKSAHGLSYYKDLANKEGFSTAYGHVGSVRDYFKDQSNGLFELDFDVVGPVSLPNDYAYYGAHTKDGSNDSKPGTMVAQACKQAYEKLGVNFADYDWDGDGEVEQVYVLYAGQGEAAGGDEDTVWPHEFQLQHSDWGTKLVLGKTTVDTYACGSEQSVTLIRNNFTGTYQLKEFPDGIGTICHEFSHCLGLPDMYDVNYGGNFGMGPWDLMDQGSYNGDGRGYRPANFTAYEKMYAGWISPIELNKEATVKGMKSSSEHGQIFVVYNDATKDEYYLLENRQQNGRWDSALPGKGLMITHVDFNPTIWQMNYVNTNVNFSSIYGDKYAYMDNDHQRCTIFHADNDESSTDTSLAGDLYPYNGNNSLTDSSYPASIIYQGGQTMGKPITNITQNEDGTIDFDFMGGSSDNVISGIHDVKINAIESSKHHIYSIDGRYLGDCFDNLDNGIYIVGGKKIVK